MGNHRADIQHAFEPSTGSVQILSSQLSGPIDPSRVPAIEITCRMYPVRSRTLQSVFALIQTGGG
jgi:hypothetical protein